MRNQLDVVAVQDKTKNRYKLLGVPVSLLVKNVNNNFLLRADDTQMEERDLNASEEEKGARLFNKVTFTMCSLERY